MSELGEKEDELDELNVDADEVDEDELDELNCSDDELELCIDDELLLVPGMGVRRFWEKTANTVGSMWIATVRQQLSSSASRARNVHARAIPR